MTGTGKALGTEAAAVPATGTPLTLGPALPSSTPTSITRAPPGAAVCTRCEGGSAVWLLAKGSQH